MKTLLTKKDVAVLLGCTEETAEKRLFSLGVPRLDWSLVGGKGIHYRLSDIKYALEKIEVYPQGNKNRSRIKRTSPDIFDMPVKEAIEVILTETAKSQ